MSATDQRCPFCVAEDRARRDKEDLAVVDRKNLSIKAVLWICERHLSTYRSPPTIVWEVKNGR